MDILEIMKRRHSVRQYEVRAIEGDTRRALETEVKAINRETGLSIQLLFDEPKCFDSGMAHYGRFSGVTNYIALVGPKGENLDEQCGYWGEKLVLLAQSLGLNTCWVAMTYGKSAAVVRKGEKEVCLISLGYGKNQGSSHQGKTLEQVTRVEGEMPDWFRRGMEAVLLAPTAANQQKFLFICRGDSVSAQVSGFGFYAKVDLGIVKYHFEAVTGRKVS